MAEERFKKLTPLQWLFHYYEVLKFKEKEATVRTKLLDLILDRLEVLWVTTNPKLGYELLESVKKGKINKSKDIDGITPENFPHKWNEMLPHLPKFIKVPELEKKKYVFPTFKRSQLRDKVLGIHVDQP